MERNDAAFEHDPTDAAAAEAAQVAAGDLKKRIEKVSKRYYKNAHTGWKALVNSGRARVPEQED